MKDYAPNYHITVDGQDITATVNSRLESLTLTDNRGMDADELELSLSDHDGKLAIPKKGAVIKVAIGWREVTLVDKGSYTVDEVTHSGSPDKLTIRARAADLRKGLSDKREESHHETTIGELVSKIAARNKLVPAVSTDLVSEKIQHIDQTSESDINLLTRVAHDFDAVATVKQGKLVFCRAGEAKTISGKAMPVVQITRRMGDQHSYTSADRDSYEGVTAQYQDHQKAVREDVTVGNRGENVKRLRHIYASKAAAERAAKSAIKKQKREAAKLSLTLALGRPELVPETKVQVSGFKPQIDSTEWVVTKVTHQIGDSGYTSQVELEITS